MVWHLKPPRTNWRGAHLAAQETPPPKAHFHFCLPQIQRGQQMNEHPIDNLPEILSGEVARHYHARCWLCPARKLIVADLPSAPNWMGMELQCLESSPSSTVTDLDPSGLTI